MPNTQNSNVRPKWGLRNWKALGKPLWDTENEIQTTAWHQPVRTKLNKRARKRITQDKRSLIVGCGGGIYTEAMASLAPKVKGHWHLGEAPLAVAKITPRRIQTWLSITKK